VLRRGSIPRFWVFPCSIPFAAVGAPLSLPATPLPPPFLGCYRNLGGSALCFRYRCAKPRRYRFGDAPGSFAIASGYRLGTTPNLFSRRFAWQRKGKRAGERKSKKLHLRSNDGGGQKLVHFDGVSSATRMVAHYLDHVEGDVNVNSRVTTSQFLASSPARQRIIPLLPRAASRVPQQSIPRP